MRNPPYGPHHVSKVTVACCPVTDSAHQRQRPLRMRTAVSCALRKRHHGGVRRQREVCVAEGDGTVAGGDSGSHRYRQVQAGHRDRETVSGGNNQRRFHAGKTAVNARERAGRPGRGSPNTS